MPKVSVIVPNYNHAPFLKQRIESILNQSFQDFELILLDDCSTDNSREIIDNYHNHPKVTRVVYNDQNSGSAFHQWKKGMELAQGEWVWIAESDDWAEPEFLAHMIESTRGIANCSLVTCVSRIVDENGQLIWMPTIVGETTAYSGEEFIRQRLSAGNGIDNVSSCLIHRQSFHPEQSYLYDHMRLCGDWMFYVLLAEQGSVVAVQEPLNHFRQHSTNTTMKGEHQGLTFLEGADVLERLIYLHGLRRFGRAWGRLWAKYERRFDFTHEVNNAIRHRYRRYPSVRLWHNIYRIRLWLK